ncbi:hypothetical protein GCM10023155_47410 [Bremerella cremea]
MSEFSQVNTDCLSDDDINALRQIASTYLQQGESVLQIRAFGVNEVRIDIGIVVNRRAGSGRKITVERNEGRWDVKDIKGWMG